MELIVGKELLPYLPLILLHEAARVSPVFRQWVGTSGGEIPLSVDIIGKYALFLLPFVIRFLRHVIETEADDL